jgi:hypothetical protein
VVFKVEADAASVTSIAVCRTEERFAELNIPENEPSLAGR